MLDSESAEDNQIYVSRMHVRRKKFVLPGLRKAHKEGTIIIIGLVKGD